MRIVLWRGMRPRSFLPPALILTVSESRSLLLRSLLPRPLLQAYGRTGFPVTTDFYSRDTILELDSANYTVCGDFAC